MLHFPHTPTPVFLCLLLASWPLGSVYLACYLLHHSIHLDGNPITKGQLIALEGFDVFDGRRKKRITKEIAGGLTDTDRSVCGLD